MSKALKTLLKSITAKSKSRVKTSDKSNKIVWVTLRNVRGSPRKYRLVLDSIKRLSVAQAERRLITSKKKGAQIVLKMLHQIKHQAREKGIDISQLQVATGWVNKGITLKRIMPAARGSAVPIRKRFSHISLCCAQT